MSKVIDREHDYKEKMSEAMLQHVAQIAEDELLDEAVDGDVVFSERHEKEMAKLFASMEPKKTKVVPLKRVLILVAILAGLLAAAVGTIATNPKIINMFRKPTETYTEIRFDEVESSDASFSFGGITLEYIPEGMEPIKVEENEGFINLKFQNGEKYFQFRMLEAKPTSDLDNEESSEEKIQIWGEKAYIQERNENISLRWGTETRWFTLLGNLEKEEIIKIAENIQ